MFWRGSLNGYVLNGMTLNGSVPFVGASAPRQTMRVDPERRTMLVPPQRRNMIVVRRHDEDQANPAENP